MHAHRFAQVGFRGVIEVAPRRVAKRPLESIQKHEIGAEAAVPDPPERFGGPQLGKAFAITDADRMQPLNRGAADVFEFHQRVFQRRTPEQRGMTLSIVPGPTPRQNQR